MVFNYMRENLIDGESRACSVPLQAGESDEERNRALLEELIGPIGEREFLAHHGDAGLCMAQALPACLVCGKSSGVFQ